MGPSGRFTVFTQIQESELSEWVVTVQGSLIHMVFMTGFSSEKLYHLQKWHEPGQQVLGGLRWRFWGDKDLEGSGGGAAADRGLCCTLELRPEVGLMC